MSTLYEIVQFLDSYLEISKITDFEGAWNGLQIENSGNISKIVAAVDFSENMLNQLSSFPNTLFIVHHGVFWQGVEPITGLWYRKLKLMMENDSAVYSVHLPLDIHHEVGNNILLAKALNLNNIKLAIPFGDIHLGIIGNIVPIHRKDLIKKISNIIHYPVSISLGKRTIIERILIVTGSGGSQIKKVEESSIDAFITGEGSHWTSIMANEKGINLIFAGHYATETFGVKALSQHLATVFNLPYRFIHAPTHLSINQ